jgi:[ribosomal protein S18]-alanine N-acetyltransferase
MNVRRATRADIRAMVEIERENPTSTNWSHEHYESLFRTVTPESSRYFVLVVEDQAESRSMTLSPAISPIVAYLAAHCVDSDWELQYIVVAKKFRSSGLATLLLHGLMKHARANNASAIFLEVRESNQSARSLYRKLGFVQAGSRKSYYSNPSEDAALYRLSLSHNETAPEIWH